jgi:ubiquinone/menaquinone biosynthesis C-methylase UbiE
MRQAQGITGPHEDAPAPLAGPLAALTFAVGQAVRVAWFMGEYRLAQRLTSGAAPPRQSSIVTPNEGVFIAELRRLLIEDWRNIEAGLYRLPHDLWGSPRRLFGDTLRFFDDLPDVERRRRGRISAEVRHHPPSPAAARLPRYYLQNFHFQTDGYLSDRSARLYDHQVEVLFGGGADAMRRQALVPIYQALRSRPAAAARLLDVGAGTGRFLTFVKDNYPRLDVTALDLSPNYLAVARRRLARWPRTRFVQAAAEAMPLAAASCDIVTCIYLFHELPRAVRGRAAAEMARVLKPGGRLVLVDSLQRGDRPAFDGLLARFPVSFHEPYFEDYTRQDLTALFTNNGLEKRGETLAYLSKILILDKSREVSGKRVTGLSS